MSLKFTIASLFESRLAFSLATSMYLMLLSMLSIYTYYRRGGRNRVGSIATRYVDRIPVGARFSAPVQTGTGVQPASYTMDKGSLSRG